MDLRNYVDSLAAKGRYHFTTDEAVVALHASLVAVRAALRRLHAKGQLANPVRGFYLNVPPEYRALSCPPPEQFVPELMEYLRLPYYAGLLSAASLHGAAHQAPMAFQVVVPDNRSAIRCGRVRVDFVARRNVADVPVVQQNTRRGVIRISSPEATAFDLVGYPRHAGSLSNVATILAELAEKLDAAKLVAETERSPIPWAQRLGYLLDRVGAESLTERLAQHVASHAREFVLLRPGRAVVGAPRSARWRLLLNDVVEPEL